MLGSGGWVGLICQTVYQYTRQGYFSGEELLSTWLGVLFLLMNSLFRLVGGFRALLASQSYFYVLEISSCRSSSSFCILKNKGWLSSWLGLSRYRGYLFRHLHMKSQQLEDTYFCWLADRTKGSSLMLASSSHLSLPMKYSPLKATSQAIMPIDQTSTSGPYFLLRKISGAMQGQVPIAMSNCCFWAAKPKSPILYTLVALSSPLPILAWEMNTFQGFRSRCTIFISLMYSSPLTRQYRTSTHSASVNFLSLSSYSRVPPEHNYMAMQMCLSVLNTSSCLTRNGQGSYFIFLLNFLITEISLKIIYVAISQSAYRLAREICFRATYWLVWQLKALYTLPKLPSPSRSFSVKVYLPYLRYFFIYARALGQNDIMILDIVRK